MAAGNPSEPDFTKTKMGAFGGNTYISTQCLLQAATITVAMDGGDHRLGQGQQAWIQAILKALCARCVDPFDIGTDTKGASLATDNPHS